MVSEKEIFNHFYENQPFLPPQQPIKFTDLDKSHMKRRGLLNKHFCKKKFQISPIRQKKLFRSSDGGNRSHNVSLPIILKKTKVGQILQYSCISLLLVPILLYWIQVSVSLNVLLYFGAEMATFCIKHIENRKIFF